MEGFLKFLLRNQVAAGSEIVDTQARNPFKNSKHRSVRQVTRAAQIDRQGRIRAVIACKNELVDRRLRRAGAGKQRRQIDNVAFGRIEVLDRISAVSNRFKQECVGPGTAIKHVVTGPTRQHIITFLAEHDIIAGTASQDIITAIADAARRSDRFRSQLFQVVLDVIERIITIPSGRRFKLGKHIPACARRGAQTFMNGKRVGIQRITEQDIATVATDQRIAAGIGKVVQRARPLQRVTQIVRILYIKRAVRAGVDNAQPAQRG